MRPIYRLGRTATLMFASTYLRARYVSRESVPLEGAAILAANHASYIDPFLIGAGLNREINYLARESLFRFPGVGALLRAWNSVPVDRDGGGGAGLKAILGRLLAGGGIILFPEGTRTSDGNLQPARSGIGLIVIKSSAPVIPVRVFGTFEAYNRHMTFPRPGKVTVVYGQQETFGNFRSEAKVCAKARLKEIYQEVADQIMERVARLRPSEPGPSV